MKNNSIKDSLWFAILTSVVLPIIVAFGAAYTGVLVAQKNNEEFARLKQEELQQARFFKALDVIRDIDKTETEKWAREIIGPPRSATSSANCITPIISQIKAPLLMPLPGGSLNSKQVTAYILTVADHYKETVVRYERTLALIKNACGVDILTEAVEEAFETHLQAK